MILLLVHSDDKNGHTVLEPLSMAGAGANWFALSLYQRESNLAISSSPVKIIIFNQCSFGVLQAMWELEIFSNAPGRLGDPLRVSC